MRRACDSTVRRAAKHRSDSAARSTPTRSAAKGHAQNINKLLYYSIKIHPPMHLSMHKLL
ncbi:MAG: hypothetical protein NZ455_05595 [Bacteroidia bacterium]|nr:hypothetical protein [Bacteroidia bacterium]